MIFWKQKSKKYKQKIKQQEHKKKYRLQPLHFILVDLKKTDTAMKI